MAQAASTEGRPSAARGEEGGGIERQASARKKHLCFALRVSINGSKHDTIGNHSAQLKGMQRGNRA